MPERSLWDEFANRAPELLAETGAHLWMVGSSVAIAVLVAIPLGVWSSWNARARQFVPTAVGTLQTVPSIAMLAFLLAAFDLFGKTAAIVALTLYALLPIVRNTLAGIESVPASAREAALGLGMTRWQMLRVVELPIALPVIFAGIRTATVIGVGIATLAAFIGADGLGKFINRGLGMDNTNLILVGAIPAAALAIALDQLLGVVERLLAGRRHLKKANA